MAFITVNIEGVSDAIAALEHMKTKVIVATRQATERSGSVLQATAVGEFNNGTAPNTRTGFLQRSIIAWPVVQQGPATYMVQVNPTAIYSRIQELGGTITPKERQYLSWVTDGRRYFKKSVTLRPRPYLRPATESMVTKMPPIFYEAWKKEWSV